MRRRDQQAKVGKRETTGPPAVSHVPDTLRNALFLVHGQHRHELLAPQNEISLKEFWGRRRHVHIIVLLVHCRNRRKPGWAAVDSKFHPCDAGHSALPSARVEVSPQHSTFPSS